MNAVNKIISTLLTITILFCETEAYGRSYIIESTATTWNEAETICYNKYGTTLATVIDEEDKVSLQNAITQATVPDNNDGPPYYGFRIWIGLTDKANEGYWVWQDGSECSTLATKNTATIACIDYWGSDEPNNQSPFGSENCVEITVLGDGTAISANDLPCNVQSLKKYPACNSISSTAMTTTSLSESTMIVSTRVSATDPDKNTKVTTTKQPLSSNSLEFTLVIVIIVLCNVVFIACCIICMCFIARNKTGYTTVLRKEPDKNTNINIKVDHEEVCIKGQYDAAPSAPSTMENNVYKTEGETYRFG